MKTTFTSVFALLSLCFLTPSFACTTTMARMKIQRKRTVGSVAKANRVAKHPHPLRADSPDSVATNGSNASTAATSTATIANESRLDDYERDRQFARQVMAEQAEESDDDRSTGDIDGPPELLIPTSDLIDPSGKSLVVARKDMHDQNAEVLGVYGGGIDPSIMEKSGLTTTHVQKQGKMMRMVCNLSRFRFPYNHYSPT